MATNALEITFPGNLAQVDTAADLRAVPTPLLDHGTLYLVLGLQGLYAFDTSSTAADDGATTIRPNDRSPLQAGRWIKEANGLAPGLPGNTGAAANTFSTIAAIQAWPSTNLSAVLAAPNIGGAFAWNPANLSTQVTADPLHRWWIPPLSDQTGASGAWERQDRGNVDVVLFGAATDTSDNATAFERAIAVAKVLGRPITGPNGLFLTSRTVQAETGIVASGGFTIGALPGTQSYWSQTLEDDSAVNRPIVRFGWHLSDNPNLCTVPARGFKVRGLAIRTAMRSSDPTTCSFLGDGILFDESCKDMVLNTVETSFCFKGWNFNSRNGHCGAINSKASNCWYNRWFERQTGDNRFFNIDLTGALFAGTGGHSTLKEPGIATGGFVGLTDIGVHHGFAPYGFYQPESGNGTVGMSNNTFIDCSQEQIANCVYKGGWATNRVTGGNDWRDARQNFTNAADTANYNAYTIQGDGNFPIKEPMRLMLVQGSRMQYAGFGFTRGTFNGVSAHTIVGTLNIWFRDEFDPSGIAVTNGKDMVLGIRPVWTTALPTSAVTLTTGAEPTLVGFTLPNDLNNTGNFLLNMRATSNNTNAGPIDIVIRQKLNAGGSTALATVTIPPGKAPFVFPAGIGVEQNLAGRTLTLSATTPTDGVSLTVGQASLQNMNPGAI